MAGEQAADSKGGRSTWRMALGRWLRHAWVGSAQVRRTFSPLALSHIEAAIAQSEQQHRVEIRFAIEPSLSWRALWQGQTARDRALEVFAHSRLWDTEENTGLLIYLLWADRAVEIVADRGVSQRVPFEDWDAACAEIVAACRRREAVQGVVSALARLTPCFAENLPVGAGRGNPNELPDVPLHVRF